MKVVYVDDEPVLCRVFKRILERDGHAVETFTNPHDALAFLRGNEVDVLVCDYRMPEMTGLELVERLDQRPPTYFISGDLGIVERLEGHPRIDGVVAKPLRPEVLLELIRRHV